MLHGLLTPRPIFYSRSIRLLLVTLVGLPVAISGSAVAMGWVQFLATLASLGYIAALTLRRLPPPRTHASVG